MRRHLMLLMLLVGGACSSIDHLDARKDAGRVVDDGATYDPDGGAPADGGSGLDAGLARDGGFIVRIANMWKAGGPLEVCLGSPFPGQLSRGGPPQLRTQLGLANGLAFDEISEPLAVPVCDTGVLCFYLVDPRTQDCSSPRSLLTDPSRYVAINWSLPDTFRPGDELIAVVNGLFGSPTGDPSTSLYRVNTPTPPGPGIARVRVMSDTPNGFLDGGTHFFTIDQPGATPRRLFQDAQWRPGIDLDTNQFGRLPAPTDGGPVVLEVGAPGFEPKVRVELTAASGGAFAVLPTGWPGWADEPLRVWVCRNGSTQCIETRGQ